MAWDPVVALLTCLPAPLSEGTFCLCPGLLFSNVPGPGLCTCCFLSQNPFSSHIVAYIPSTSLQLSVQLPLISLLFLNTCVTPGVSFLLLFDLCPSYLASPVTVYLLACLFSVKERICLFLLLLLIALSSVSRTGPGQIVLDNYLPDKQVCDHLVL